MKIAIVGATGLVGSKFIQVLQEKDVQADYTFFSSSKSAGVRIKMFDKQIKAIDLETYNGEKFDYALFSAGGAVSKKYCPLFAKAGAIVIDNSSAFRMNKDIPLIVPEVNSINALHSNIIANPNCSTIQLVQVLHQLSLLSKIKRVVVSTYQSVSGAGIHAMAELANNSRAYLEKKEENNQNFPQGIAFNCIPQIDEPTENGYTKEEMKMINETSKILEQKIPMTVTCVRVPVMNSHSESVNVEFEDDFDIDHLKEVLSKDKNIEIMDDLSQGVFPTSRDGVESNKTFVGRIRKDHSKENSVNLWIVSDNLRKGAALNAVQILEYLIRNK